MSHSPLSLGQYVSHLVENNDFVGESGNSNSESNLRPQISELFVSRDVDLDSGTISGNLLAEWANGVGLSCEKKVLRRCMPSGTRFGRMTLVQCLQTMERYQRAQDCESSGKRSSAHESLATSGKKVIKLSLTQYLLLKVGCVSKASFLSRDDPADAGHGENSSSASGSLAAEENVDFVLDPDACSAGARTQLMAVSISIILLVLFLILLLMSLLWETGVKNREQENLLSTASLMNFVETDLVESTQNDFIVESSDYVSAVSDWIERLYIRLENVVSAHQLQVAAKLSSAEYSSTRSTIERIILGTQSSHGLVEGAISGSISHQQFSEIATASMNHLHDVVNSLLRIPDNDGLLSSVLTNGNHIKILVADTTQFQSELHSVCTDVALMQKTASLAIGKRLIAEVSAAGVLTQLNDPFEISSHDIIGLVAITPIATADSTLCTSIPLSYIRRIVIGETSSLAAEVSSKLEELSIWKVYENHAFLNMEDHFPKTFHLATKVAIVYARSDFSSMEEVHASTDSHHDSITSGYCDLSDCRDALLQLKKSKSGGPQFNGSLSFDGSVGVVTSLHLHDDIFVLIFASTQQLRSLLISTLVPSFKGHNSRNNEEFSLAVLSEDAAEYEKVLEDPIVSKDTDRIVQLTPFAHPNKCFGDCRRRFPSTSAARKGFDTHSFGSLVYPDYKPVPVIGSFAFIKCLNAVFIVETELVLVNNRALQVLTRLVKHQNERSGETGMEAIIVWDSVSLPIVEFSSSDGCPKGAVCYIEDSTLLLRSDCVKCISSALSLNASSQEWRVPHLLSHNNLQSDDQLSREVFSNSKTDTSIADIENYRGEKVSAVVSHLHPLNVTLVLTVSSSAATEAVGKSAKNGIGGEVAMTIVGCALVVVLVRFVVRKVEARATHEKELLEGEKRLYFTLIEATVPHFIHEKLIGGQTMIARSHKLVALADINCVAFSELSYMWSPNEVVRFTTYFSYVVDHLCTYYSGIRLHTLGDEAVCVSGLEEAYASQSSTSSKVVDPSMYALNLSRLSSVIIQLFSEQYTHNPSQIDCLTKAYVTSATAGKVGHQEGESSTTIEAMQKAGEEERISYLFGRGMKVLPKLRVGLHYGPVSSGASLSSSGVKFDCYGKSLSIARRMQLTAGPGRIHMTVQFKEALYLADKDDAFELEPPRKTVVKGTSTIVSYLLYSAHLPMPQIILNQLKVFATHGKHFYAGAQETGTGTSATVTTSETQGSTNSPGESSSSSHTQ